MVPGHFSQLVQRLPQEGLFSLFFRLKALSPLVVLIIYLLCSCTGSKKQEVEVTIFCASSLAPIVEQLKLQWEKETTFAIRQQWGSEEEVATSHASPVIGDLDGNGIADAEVTAVVGGPHQLSPLTTVTDETGRYAFPQAVPAK